MKLKHFALILASLVLTSSLYVGGSVRAQTPESVAAPTNFSVTVPADAGVVFWITWNDNATNETTYELDKSISGQDGPFTPLVFLPPNTDHYEDRDVIAGTEYWYRVAVINSEGVVEYSPPDGGVAGGSYFPRPSTPTPEVVLPVTGGGPTRGSSLQPGVLIALLLTLAGSVSAAAFAQRVHRR